MSPGTPEQLALRFLRELRAALRRSGRRSLRVAETLDGLRLVVGARVSARPAPAADLPAELRDARPSVRKVYRAIRALRAELGPDAPVLPARIVEHLDAADPNTVHSVDTINHAVRELRDRGVAASAPRRGWALNPPARLPASKA